MVFVGFTIKDHLYIKDRFDFEIIFPITTIKLYRSFDIKLTRVLSNQVKTIKNLFNFNTGTKVMIKFWSGI
jgi:hypothetical protein